MSRRKGMVPHIRTEEITPEMRPKVRMVFFNVRLLWSDLETLCGAEAGFVIMLWGEGLERFHCRCAQSYGMRVPFLLGKTIVGQFEWERLNLLKRPTFP